jgi:hypothetical protein
MHCNPDSRASLRGAVYLALGTCLAAFAATATAEVQQTARIVLGPSQPSWSFFDLSGRFGGQALALTPSSDFLSFSPRRNGTWELYRVRGWGSPKPAIDHLPLPGYYSSHDERDLDDLTARVFVTPDGRYAVCSGTGEWLKRVHGRAVGQGRTESKLTVVDLATFQAVRSLRTDKFDLFEFHSVFMDAEGRIVIETNALNDKGSNAFLQLELPSLQAGQRCSFALVSDANHLEHPVATTPSTCTQMLHNITLEKYLLEQESLPPHHVDGYICANAHGEFCPQPDLFSPDLQFGLGIESEGRDSFLGSWVQTRATAFFFSVRTHREVGEMDITHQPPYLKFATFRGKTFLLFLRKGSVLTVYQLIDSAPANLQ